jgi:hypothetical protein
MMLAEPARLMRAPSHKILARLRIPGSRVPKKHSKMTAEFQRVEISHPLRKKEQPARHMLRLSNLFSPQFLN